MQREHQAYVPAGVSSLDQKIIAVGSEVPTMLVPAALDALLGSAAQPGDVSAFAATQAAPPAVSDSASPSAAQLQGMEFKPRRYTTVRQLGEGGMGDVLLSHDSAIGRRVAVKRMKRRLDPIASDQFLAEIQTTGQLEHPGIVPIYDVGQDEDGSPYFVMKYLEGEPLDQIIAKLAKGDPAYLQRFTYEHRTEIFMQLLRAVQYAHKRGVLHLDIKPANFTSFWKLRRSGRASSQSTRTKPHCAGRAVRP